VDYEGCRNDGDEPDYMAASPEEWLTSTLESCCKKHFGEYHYENCIGKYPPDADDCNIQLFYPDYAPNGANEGCLNDGRSL